MPWTKQLQHELQRIASLGGSDRLAVRLSQGEVSADLVGCDAIGCSTSQVTFSTPKLAQASVQQLRKISDDLSKRLNYLLEPISLIVVGAREATELVKIVGSHADSNADNPSVLVARP